MSQSPLNIPGGGKGRNEGWGGTRGRARAGAGLLVLLGSRMGCLKGVRKQQALLY